MAHSYQPLDEKDDIHSSDGESQDDESLLGNRKSNLISFKSNLFWITLHLLATLGLLVGLHIQSQQTTDKTCPKLLPLELRETLLACQQRPFSDLVKPGQKMLSSMKQR